MSDYSSELPIRSQLPGQVLPDDVIVKIGDGTNPTTQIASVDTFGSLQSRIADASGNVIASQHLSTTYWLQSVSPETGSASPATSSSFAALIAGQYNSTLPTLSNGQQAAIQVNSNGVLMTVPTHDQAPATQSITAQDIVTTSTSVFAQTWYTGTPTTGSDAVFALSTIETVFIQVTGTWTGTLQIEVSGDGGTTWATQGIHLIGSPIAVSSFTGNASGFMNVGGKTNVRVRATAAWTGTATVYINESLNEASVYIANPIKLLDASSATSTVEANIVAGSTAAGISNTALVTALSPNTPLPAGTNLLGGATVYVGSSPATVVNPLPVTITSASSGTPIQAYLTSVALAKGASVTLTYTVPGGHTFSWERVWISASGKIKALVANGATNNYVGFNSSSNPNIDIVVTAPPTIAAGGTVNITITNEDTSAFDVYATVEGNQIS